jgi:hypothetical protein
MKFPGLGGLAMKLSTLAIAIVALPVLVVGSALWKSAADADDPVAAAAAKAGLHGEADGIYGEPSQDYCWAYYQTTQTEAASPVWFKARRSDGSKFRWRCRGGLVIYGGDL